MCFMSYIDKTPLLQSAFIPALTVGAITPNSSQIPLGHGGCTYIARQGDIALPVHRDNVPFFFHRDSVFN